MNIILFGNTAGWSFGLDEGIRHLISMSASQGWWSVTVELGADRNRSGGLQHNHH